MAMDPTAYWAAHRPGFLSEPTTLTCTVRTVTRAPRGETGDAVHK